MHIELIGSTSAGKTTLAKKMAEVGKNNGMDISLSDDFMLEQLHLDWIRNDFVRRRVVEIVAFAIMLTCLGKYQEFLRFVLREGNSSPGFETFFEKLAYLSSFPAGQVRSKLSWSIMKAYCKGCIISSYIRTARSTCAKYPGMLS